MDIIINDKNELDDEIEDNDNNETGDKSNNELYKTPN